MKIWDGMICWWGLTMRRYENLRCKDRRCEDAQMSCGCEEVRCEDLRCEDTWMWRSKTPDVTNSIFRHGNCYAWKNKRTQKHFSTQTLFTHRRFHIPTHTLSHAHTFTHAHTCTPVCTQTLLHTNVWTRTNASTHTHAHTFEHDWLLPGLEMKLQYCCNFAGKNAKVKRCDTPWWPTGAGGNVAF